MPSLGWEIIGGRLRITTLHFASIHPKLVFAYGNRGLARAKLGDNQGALTHLRRMAELAQQQGNTDLYKEVQNLIRKLQR